MPRASQSQADSLDSLLDTMANVVGILVVLVAVTQLSLGDAVDRIREQAGERAAATPADVAAIVGEREAIEAELADVRSAIEAFSVAERDGLMEVDLVELLDRYESLPGRSAAAGDIPSEREIANDRIAVERLEGEVREAEGEHEQLLAILAEPVRNEPRTIRLPDPRPVPPGMERVFFLCRGGVVYPIDLPALEAALVQGVQEATGASKSRNIILELDDFSWIVNHFAKEDVSSQGFRWVFVTDDPTRFLAELVPTDRVEPGDPEARLRAPGSRTERALEALDPRRQYVRFFVWPDSFDVYLTARRLAEEQGLRVGWQQVREDENLRFDIMRSSRPGRRLLD